MEIGAFIKLHRIEQNMTQEELAKGIVSMSYLSKIENGRTEASSEVISMLCTRLGIHLDNEDEARIQEMCAKWYDLLFEVQDQAEIIRIHDEIQALIDKAHSRHWIMFQIHRIRYFLVLGEHKAALEQINKLTEIANSFNTLQQYYWYKFKGNYRSLNNEPNEALRMYKLAKGLLNQLDLTEEGVAELQYAIAVTYSKLRHTLEAIEYANKALQTFMKKYNFIRCAECHIILGISYRRIRMYQKALENYNLAKYLGDLSKNQEIIQLANHNLAYFHSVMGKNQEAVKNFIKVAEDPSINLHTRLPAITSLIKEFYEMKEYQQARKVIKQGLELLEVTKNNESYKLYYFIIYTYKYALEENEEKFLSLMKEEFIPYLIEQEDYVNLAIYHTMIANYFEERRKYKDAVYYLKQANNAYKELTNI